MTNEQLQMIGISETAFNAATEAERVEWGKANTTAGFGLCQSAFDWIQDKWNNVYFWGTGLAPVGRKGAVCKDGYTYRLSRDYQPPVKRWWFNTESKRVINTDSVFNNKVMIEVTAVYAAYLSEKPEGEWELRMPKKGDFMHDQIDRICDALFDYEDDGPSDRGYRWCKPKAVAGWVEYPVEVIQDSYHVIYPKRSESLYKAANRVGFGGVRFEGQEPADDWYMTTAAWIDVATCGKNAKPAKPVRARLWEVPK